MTSVDLLRWLASAPPPEEAAAVARACLDYVAGVAASAAPMARAAAQAERDSRRLDPAQAARELGLSRNVPRGWVKRGLVDDWDAATQTATWGAWVRANERKPRRGRPPKDKA